MAQDWRSYDAAAACHDRLAVPAMFTPPAQDLVDSVDAASARRLLDVGSGTGVAARASQARMPGRMVLALDPSLGMLKMAQTHGLACVVGAVPHLPFADASFDRVIASFVLSHLRDYEACLADMVRVLCPGGILGVTVWGPLESPVRRHWRTAAESFAGRERLVAALQQALPWEDWFYNPVHLQEALGRAGLSRIKVETRQYANRIGVAEFLKLRAGLSTGRFLQAHLDGDQWRRFQATVAEEFHRRFSDPLEELRDAHIAIGIR